MPTKFASQNKNLAHVIVWVAVELTATTNRKTVITSAQLSTIIASCMHHKHGYYSKP